MKEGEADIFYDIRTISRTKDNADEKIGASLLVHLLRSLLLPALAFPTLCLE